MGVKVLQNLPQFFRGEKQRVQEKKMPATEHTSGQAFFLAMADHLFGASLFAHTEFVELDNFGLVVCHFVEQFKLLLDGLVCQQFLALSHGLQLSVQVKHFLDSGFQRVFCHEKPLHH